MEKSLGTTASLIIAKHTHRDTHNEVTAICIHYNRYISLFSHTMKFYAAAEMNLQLYLSRVKFKTQLYL